MYFLSTRSANVWRQWRKKKGEAQHFQPLSERPAGLSRVFLPRALGCLHALIWECSLTLMTEGQACHRLCHPGASRQTGRWPQLALASPDKINRSGAGHAGAGRRGGVSVSSLRRGGGSFNVITWPEMGVSGGFQLRPDWFCWSGGES